MMQIGTSGQGDERIWVRRSKFKVTGAVVRFGSSAEISFSIPPSIYGLKSQRLKKIFYASARPDCQTEA